MFLLAATLAHAGLRADLDREARDAPQIAIACTSAHDTLARLRDAATELGAGAPIPPDVERFLGGLEGVLAPDARLGVAWWRDASALRISFGTALGPAELADAVARLGGDEPGRVEQGPDGWTVRDPDGSTLRVDVSEGWARLSRGAPPPGAARPLPAPLLTALPEDPGCVVSASVPDDTMGIVDIGVHLPSERGRPGSFAVALPMLKDSDAILLAGAVPPRASTVEVPESLLLVGIGLDSIDFSTFLRGKELRQARRVQRLFPITGGTTLALLASAPGPKVAAVVPFGGNPPARRIANRTRLLAKKLELPVERIDATHLVIKAGKLDVLAAADRGVLYLSTDPGALNALERGAGQPWVDAGTAGLAADWPLVLTSRTLPSPGPGQAGIDLPRPFLLTLDVQDGVIKGLVDLPLSLPQIAAIGRAVQEARERKSLQEAAEAAGTPEL